MRAWLVVVGVALVVAVEAVAPGGREIGALLADSAAGSLFLAAGVVTADRSSTRRFAVLAFLAGVAWFVGNLVGGLAALHRPLMAHAVLGYPDGRVRGPVRRAAVALMWAEAIVAPLWTWGGVSTLPAAGVAVGLVVAAAGTHSVLRSSVAGRRAALVSARAAAVLGIAIAVPPLVRMVEPITPIAGVVAVSYACAVAVVGGLLLTATVLRTGTATDVADAVIELTEIRPHKLDDVIAAVRAGSDSDATKEVSDPAVAAVLTAAIEQLDVNRGLHDALLIQVREVRRSRRRLVEAADIERKRLERRLAEGPGRHLDELADSLGVLAATLDTDTAALVHRTVDEVAATRDELEQLARGLHPRVLVERGLAAALADLARRAGVRTEVSAPQGRFSPTVETTVWYVCAEAAANVAKHSGAQRMSIEVVVDGDEIVATVTDDGSGGARMSTGSGLAGIADRLAAVDGCLELGEPTGGGTRLRARMPSG